MKILTRIPYTHKDLMGMGMSTGIHPQIGIFLMQFGMCSCAHINICCAVMEKHSVVRLVFALRVESCVVAYGPACGYVTL
ncbi:hypothetical protein Sjap_019600 [Stephania japonica]|uniref:Uncharacterized protein n=1 Tax=Stephania japonica TaxID=461633 RepID=A0AAP0HZI0_9MAGN